MISGYYSFVSSLFPSERIPLIKKIREASHTIREKESMYIKVSPPEISHTLLAVPPAHSLKEPR